MNTYSVTDSELMCRLLKLTFMCSALICPYSSQLGHITLLTVLDHLFYIYWKQSSKAYIKKGKDIEL